MVRRADPDRYFSALFAPVQQRFFLLALYAFNHELAHVGESVREPMIGEIRLQWWRETVQGARAGDPQPHDVARALTETFRQQTLPGELFDAMIAARSFDLLTGPFESDAHRDAYVDATSGNLMRLAARILGTGNRHDELAREAGLAYGLAGLARNQAQFTARRRFLTPMSAASTLKDAREHLAQARRLPRPKNAIAAFLPASLVPLYLHNPAKDVPLHRRLLRLLSSGMRGRI
jgi:phytoene synthase